MNDSDKILLQRLGAMLGVPPGYVDQAGIEEAVLAIALDKRRMRETERALVVATDALRGWHEWARSAIGSGSSVMNDHQLQFAVTTIIEAAETTRPRTRGAVRKWKADVLALLARDPGRYASEIRETLSAATAREYASLRTTLHYLCRTGDIRAERAPGAWIRYYLATKDEGEQE